MVAPGELHLMTKQPVGWAGTDSPMFLLFNLGSFTTKTQTGCCVLLSTQPLTMIQATTFQVPTVEVLLSKLASASQHRWLYVPALINEEFQWFSKKGNLETASQKLLSNGIHNHHQSSVFPGGIHIFCMAFTQTSPSKRTAMSGAPGHRGDGDLVGHKLAQQHLRQQRHDHLPVTTWC